jgi:hypothetical protein
MNIPVFQSCRHTYSWQTDLAMTVYIKTSWRAVSGYLLIAVQQQSPQYIWSVYFVSKDVDELAAAWNGMTKVCLANFFIQISLLEYCDMSSRRSWSMFQECVLSPLCSSWTHHCHDDGGRKHHWNIGQIIRDRTAHYPRKLSSSYSPPW